MSIYNNKTSKIFLDLNNAASLQQEVNPHDYRQAKISKVEIYFLDKISKRKLNKKWNV